MIHRPRSLTDDEKGATLTPPRSKCCVSAPPVLEFDERLAICCARGVGPAKAMNGSGANTASRSTKKGFVWVGGNADNDKAVLKFTGDGKFVHADRQDRAEQGQQ